MNVRMYEGENEKAGRRERVKPRYDSGTGPDAGTGQGVKVRMWGRNLIMN